MVKKGKAFNIGLQAGPENNWALEDDKGSGTSIFDPVLCEAVYSWFCPPGGKVLDPFAGGSVRGIVAAELGRRYTGVDLSAIQVDANRQQAAAILGTKPEPPDTDDHTHDPDDLTPVVDVGEIAMKRDDMFCMAHACGGKARSAWHLAQGAAGLVTAGSRQSPQVAIVAAVAERLNLPCRCHVPAGGMTPELMAAAQHGAELVQHTPGRNSVIIARAREDAAARGWTEIPFGMECHAAVEQTRRQVANIPDGRRIVIPVGSGMSLAGLLWGLRDCDKHNPVLGVMVGADPEKRLDTYAPPGWREMVTLVRSPLEYHTPAPVTDYGGVRLDPIYEAKCLPYLMAGDLFWVVGIRESAHGEPTGASGTAEWIVGDARNVQELAPGAYDLLFTCPPYGDLEVYSDDPLDLSTLPYDQFVIGLQTAVERACAMLKDDRFAVVVVGDFRDPKTGLYRNFVSDTITVFHAAGLRLYNEAILVTALGSLPIRAGKQFSASRKLGKTHQNVLVFVKGDGKRAAEACGTVEVHTEIGA